MGRAGLGLDSSRNKPNLAALIKASIPGVQPELHFGVGFPSSSYGKAGAKGSRWELGLLCGGILPSLGVEGAGDDKILGVDEFGPARNADQVTF